MIAKQRGVALIIVLMVVALVSIIATEMGGRLQLHVQRAANIKDNNQAYWYAMGAEQYARRALQQVLDLDDGVVHLNQPWAQNNLQFPLPGGGIEARIEDMRSCFNLNALQSTEDNRAALEPRRDAFFRLLQNIDAEIPSLEAETLRDSLIDWLDSDSILYGSYGAEDADYESRLPPYLAANGLMGHESELRLVNGAEPQWLGELLPYVCAIPGDAEMKININTLDVERAQVLQALLNMPRLEDAVDSIQARPRDGYETAEEFLQQPDITALNLADEQRQWFDVTTQYFILHTNTRYNDAIFRMSSVLRVDGNNVAVVRREFGGPQ